jgi:hypothetical protein
MRKDTEGHLLVLVVIGRVVITDQIDDGSCGYRRLEEPRLRNQLCAKLSAIADAFHSDTIAIDPEVAAHRSAHDRRKPRLPRPARNQSNHDS